MLKSLGNEVWILVELVDWSWYFIRIHSSEEWESKNRHDGAFIPEHQELRPSSEWEYFTQRSYIAAQHFINFCLVHANWFNAIFLYRCISLSWWFGYEDLVLLQLAKLTSPPAKVARVESDPPSHFFTQPLLRLPVHCRTNARHYDILNQSRDFHAVDFSFEAISAD